MKKNEIQSSYEHSDTEKLKRLANEIFSIKDEYKIILLNELSARGEIEFVQKINALLNYANNTETLIEEFVQNGDRSQKLKELEERGFDLKTIEVEKKKRDSMTFSIPNTSNEFILLIEDSTTNTLNLMHNKESIHSISLDIIGPGFEYITNQHFGKIGIRKKNNAHYELTFNDIHSTLNPSHPFNVLEFLPYILFLISIGPILDIFLRLSLFAKDPAPKVSRIIMEMLFFSIYFASAYLVLKRKYWAVWISLTVYSLTTAVCFLIINNSGLTLNSLAEVIVRISIILFILSKIPALISVKKYNLLKNN